MQKEKTKTVILSILNVLEYTDQINFLNLHHGNVARIWGLLWSVFSPIWTEYGDLQSKSPENTYQNILQRLQCFPVNNAKLLRTPILKNICGRLLLDKNIIWEKRSHSFWVIFLNIPVDTSYRRWNDVVCLLGYYLTITWICHVITA